MKFARYGIALVAFSAVLVAQVSLTPSAQADVKSTTRSVVAKSGMGFLHVDCRQHPSARILKYWTRDHICGHGGRPITMPNGYVSGNCGSVSNSVSNNHGGRANLSVTITAWWYTGGMVQIVYSGTWHNNNTGTTHGVGNIQFAPGAPPIPFFSWTDSETYYTDTGTVVFTVSTQEASTYFYGNCYLASPITATAVITL